MDVLLSLGAAVLLGAADFAGGIATRRSGVISVMLLSRIVGVCVLLPLAWTQPGWRFIPGDLGWGALAGLAGGAGLAVLYSGLATSEMAVTAPVTAVIAAMVPVVTGLLLGDRPARLTMAGIVLAMVGIAFVSRKARSSSPSRGPVAVDRKSNRALFLGVVAGLAIGAFYVLLSRVSEESGLWPLAAARSAALGLFMLLAVLKGVPAPLSRALGPMALAAAVLDLLGTILFLFATHEGSLAIVGFLTSLYPASTVLLAVLFLGERLSRARVVGLSFAVDGACLITMTSIGK